MRMRMIINKKMTLWLGVFVLLLGGVGCADTSSENTGERLYSRQYLVFGTVLDVLVWAPENQQQALDEALLAVEQRLNAMHHQWHAWKPGRLQAINAALRAGRSIELTEEERQLIQRARALSEQTQGRFNPAVGELVHLWGFHADEFPLHSPPPDAAAIEQWRSQHPDMQNLVFEGKRLRSRNRAIWLDFGGIAKGYATDVAAAILRNHGFPNSIINAGGDVLVSGKKGLKPWRVAVRAPDGSWQGEVVAVIPAKAGEAIFTSGNYQRYTEYNGTRYAHILDPRSGWPVKAVASATVIAPDGTTADAAATALMVAGWRDWPAVAAGLGLNQVLMLGASGRCEMSAAMAQRLSRSRLHCQVRPLKPVAASEPRQSAAQEQPKPQERP